MAFHDDEDTNDSYSDESESNESEIEVSDEELKSYSRVDKIAGDSNGRHMNYTVLSLEDISERQRNVIATLSDVLSLTESETAILLRHFNWHAENANYQWFADEEKVRNTLGLLLQPGQKHEPKEAERKEITTCQICFDDYDMRDMKALKYCDHLYCQNCWRAYIHTSINYDGLACLNLRCPFRDPPCRAIESHRPIDCGTVKNWVDQIKDGDALSMYWIRSNSKPCPKCKRPIEKSHGCMKMKCIPPCQFKFCWLCHDSWDNDSYGGHSCNKYRPEAATSGKDDGNQPNSATYDHVKEKVAKASSNRLVFYLERWKENERSERKALSDLQSAQKVQLKRLNDCLCGWAGFKCVEMAWLQIAECRRMLKWTYAYGYYLTPFGNRNADLAKLKQELFEFLQREAENGLEQLHQCAEDELQQHIDSALQAKADTEIGKKALKDLENVFIRLEELTKSTAAHFEKLIEAFENDLLEVKNTRVGCPKAARTN
eukprot:PITA_20673